MSDPGTRRVVVTGLGLISPLGNSPRDLWEGLRSGRSGVARLSGLPADHLPVQHAAEARDFKGGIEDFGVSEAALKRTIRKGLKVMCREIQMGVAAAQHALTDAGLAGTDFDHDRAGVIFGSDYIMTTPEEFSEGVRECLDEQSHFRFDAWAERGMPKVTPLWLLKFLPNMPASHIAIYNDLRGPNNSLTMREASANLALAEAWATLTRGSADFVVAGATGTRIHPLRTVHVILQEELAVEGDPVRRSRPFDRQRQGAVLGEGAGVMVLEDLSVARRRGARILAEVVGYGSSAVLDRDGRGSPGRAIENALRQALATSRLEPDQLGHVHAHGLSTRLSDAEEAQAIERVFRTRSSPLPVVAAKGNFGNLGAGSGMVEVIASTLALARGILFPILNYEHPDPDCPIHPATPETPSGDSFVSLSVSPQGQASAIVLRRPGPA